MSLTEAAWGIRQILDSKMADLLRRMTIARGYDARDFTLLANGGAGPSHAWVLCEELGLGGFIVPAAATAESAYGTANSDIGFTGERPAYARVSPGGTPTTEQLARVADALDSAAVEVRANLALAAPNAHMTVERYVSIRFRGQTNHQDVAVGDGTFDLAAYTEATQRFEKQYETLFGRGAAFSNAGYEMLSVRVMGTAALAPPAVATKGGPLTAHTSRKVVFGNPKTAVDTAIYLTTFPQAGATVQGPAIIEFPGQSVVVPPGMTATADNAGNLHVTRNKP
jgi:N-methylhydantoinase A